MSNSNSNSPNAAFAPIIIDYDRSHAAMETTKEAEFKRQLDNFRKDRAAHTITKGLRNALQESKTGLDERSVFAQEGDNIGVMGMGPLRRRSNKNRKRKSRNTRKKRRHRKRTHKNRKNRRNNRKQRRRRTNKKRRN